MNTTTLRLRILRIVICFGLIFVSACVDSPHLDVELPAGARVQYADDPAGSRWTAAIVGTVGECTALMVPDSWDAPEGYIIVRIDSISALVVSDRYDGRTGEDGRLRATRVPPDTVGEGWTPVPIEALRRRYGGCEPGFSGPP